MLEAGFRPLFFFTVLRSEATLTFWSFSNSTHFGPKFRATNQKLWKGRKYNLLIFYLDIEYGFIIFDFFLEYIGDITEQFGSDNYNEIN